MEYTNQYEAGAAALMTDPELRMDNYLSFLWAIASLREKISGEPALDNWLKWQENHRTMEKK